MAPCRDRRATVSRRLLLTVVCSVQLIDAYDVAAMGPALPRIQHDLGMSPNALQWVITAYVLGYGGFLLLGGRLADVLDRKRLFIGSVVMFAAVSAVGGAADAGWLLIAARLVKGIAAAFGGPVALAILLHVHDDDAERDRALGAYLAMAAVGFTSGLVLGGVLAAVSWRLVLLVPAGLALLAAVVAAGVVPSDPLESRRAREPVDVFGAVTVTAGLMALVYGVDRASTTSFGDGVTVASLASASVLLVVFVAAQRTRRVPLVAPGILRACGRWRADAFAFLLQGGYVGWQFIATLFLQNVEHWSPIAVGIVFVPNSLIALATARRWAVLVGRVGPWPIASAGVVLMLAAYLWTVGLGGLNDVLVFAPASLVLGAGYTMAYTAANITAVGGAHPQHRGAASGLFIASLQVGSGVILGAVTTVFSAHVAVPGPGAYRWAIATAAATAALAAVLSVSAALRPGHCRDRDVAARDERRTSITPSSLRAGDQR
jgi:MFS family permease